MRQSSVNQLILLSFAGLALGGPAAAGDAVKAGTHLDKFTSDGATVTISGVVDVPLYVDPDGGLPMVVGKVGDKEFLFQLGSTTHFTTVTADVLAAAEVEAKEGNKRLINLKGKSGKSKYPDVIEYAELPSLTIGGLELGELAVVTADKASDDTGKAPYTESGDLASGGTLGLGALPGVSYAVLPSKGVVRFTPAAQGAQLLDDVGGTKATFTRLDSFTTKFGKSDVYSMANAVVVDTAFGEGSVPVAVNLASGGSGVDRRAIADQGALYEKGDTDYRWISVGLPESDAVNVWVEALDQYAMWETAEGVDFPRRGFLGANVLAAYDIAVDNGTNTLAYSIADAVKAENPRSWLLAQAEAALVESQEGGDDAEDADAAASSDDEDAPKGSAAAWGKVAKAAAAAGDTERAVAAYAAVVAHDETSCQAWMDLGHAQEAAFDWTAAADAHAAAALLFHSWWDLSVDEREELAKEAEKLEKDELEVPEGTPVAQPAACHVADGNVATVKLASGAFTDVEGLYRAHLDLDPGLARAWGAAALAMGRYGDAHEPYRQAIKLTGHASARDYLGLAIAYGQQDNWTQARTNHAASVKTWNDSLAAELYIDAVRSNEGSAQALQAAAALAKDQPDSIGAAYAWARESRLSGADADRKAAYEHATRLIDGQLAVRPDDPDLLAAKARYLLVVVEAAPKVEEAPPEDGTQPDDAPQPEDGGDAPKEAPKAAVVDLEPVKAAADAALALNPANAQAYLALADYYVAKGQGELAVQMLKKAATSDPTHPGYALMLGQLTE